MAIKSFDRDTAGRVRDKIERAIQHIVNEEGMTLKVGGRFGSDNMTLRLELGVKAGVNPTTGESQSKLLLTHCRLNGIDPAGTFNGHILVDYNPRAYKTPFISSKAGKKYRWSTEMAQSHFKLPLHMRAA